MALKINQYLTYTDGTKDGTTQDLVAYFPESLNGRYVEFTLYVEFSHGTSAGKIQIETAFEGPHNELGVLAWPNAYAPIGSTIDWAAQDTVKTASVTGVYACIRARIQTAATSGTIRLGLVASSD